MRTTAHRSQLAPERQHGFTLIELMVTVAVLAILSTLAAPSFRELIQRNRTAAISNELVASVVKARSEAINRNSCVTLCRSTSGTQCNAGANWASGWIAFTNANCNATLDTPDATRDDALVLAAGPFNVDYTMVHSNSSRDRVMFAPVGQLRAGDNGNFNLQYLSTGTTNTSNRRICLSRLGRTLLVPFGSACP